MTAALSAVIIVGSLLPFDVPGTDIGSDKFVHGFSYFALAVLGSGIVAPERVWVVMLRCVLLGCALEIAQGLWTESRTADWRDMLANTVGVATAWVIVRRRGGWARHVEDWLQRR